MPDWHYHANHIDAPARGSKAVAYKDSRRLRLPSMAVEFAHGDGVSSFENTHEYGPDYPFVIRCYRTDCVIQREEKR